MKTYLFGLLLPLLPLLFSILQTWSHNKMRPNEILVCLPSIYSLIILLIASRSSISQKLHFNFCYSYFGILSSLMMTFISYLINYTFTLVILQQFRVYKFMISQFHLQNTTMALGAHMCSYGYSYRTPSRDGTLRFLFLFLLFSEINLLLEFRLFFLHDLFMNL